MASTENPLIQDHAAMTLGGRQQPPQHLQQPQPQQHARASSLGLTALMSSCQLNNELEVKALLQRKPSLTAARDRSGKTALHYCAENLTTGCAELLLLYEPGLTSVQDEEGYTTLHFAVISGNRTMVRFLVERGADVNCVDNEKHSCVHWATVCGELECMDILVSAGANPSTADIHGAYPIHYAAQMCGPNSEMGNDVRVGLAALRRLIELGVDVSVRDQDGRPPLLWAASVETRPSKTYCPSGSSDAILALVNAGADVAATDKDGLTALHCAASRGHVDCLETLVSLCGADVDAVDSNGCSALFYAVTLGHADCTQLLLKYGAAPNRQDHKGRTPAHCGAAKGQMETLKILWQHGANLYMRNQRGDLPLHEAVQSGRKDLVQWLLELQPSAVNSPNNNGRCALHVAAMANSVEMCKVLMDRGAEVNPVMRNSKGQLLTPLDASLQRGNRGCAKYLRLHGALPFCKMTDRHDIDRWLQHSFSINKLHKTEQLCDSEAPPAVSGLAPEELQMLDAKHVQTLESSVQTDSGYFESREYRASRQPGDAEETVTKQGTFIEGGRTLKQAIITNVYVRTSGGARVHQPKRKRAGASKGKGDGFAEGSEGTEDHSSSGEERSVGMRESSRRKVGSQEQHAGFNESKKMHTMLDSSTTHRVVEEVIVKKQDGPEEHVVKRITRRPLGGEGDEVRVTGEMRDNVETTPEGFTSVTFSEQKSSETGRASSEDDARARFMTRDAAAARTLGDVPEGTSRQPMKSPAVIRAAERFLSLLSARRSRTQADQASQERLKDTSQTLTLRDSRIREESEAAESTIDERLKKEKKVARFQDKVKHTVKQVRQSPKRRSSSSGRSSSESEPASTTKKDKGSRTKGAARSLSREPSGGQQRRREADEAKMRKQKQEKTPRRAVKSGGHSEAAVKGASDKDQSASSDSSEDKKPKHKDASVSRKDSVKTRPKDSVSTKKDSRRSAKGPDGRHSESKEELSSSAEGSDSAVDDGGKKESMHVKSEARDARDTASRDLNSTKEVNVDERLESATHTKMHREYEEIESHATMAEFFSETSMSDSALEQRSDRLLARHEEGATKEALKDERASRERGAKKPRSSEKDQKVRDAAERKSTYQAKGKDRSSKQPREQEKVGEAKKDRSRKRDTDLGEGSDSQGSEKAATDAAGQDGGAGIEVSEDVVVSKIERHRTKVEERVVQEASSSESVAESTSERIDRSDTTVTKRTVLEKNLGTKKAQSKKSEVTTDHDSEGQKSSEKVTSTKKKATTTKGRSSKERRAEESGRSEEEIVSTEICEEEIIEKHATELNVVEILETRATGEATTPKDDIKSKASSKKEQRQKHQVKHKTTDKHNGAGDGGEKAKRKKDTDSVYPVVGDDKCDQLGSTRSSVSSSEELEAAPESFESSQETVSVTKEISNVRFKKEVTSEETLREISKEEIVEHASEITVAEGEPAFSTADVASTEKVEKEASIEQDKTTEKSKVSSAVAEAVIDLYSRVQRTSPSNQEQLASQKQPAPSTEHVPSEGARKEGADSRESLESKESCQGTSDEHESQSKKSHIPPVVAEAVSDLLTHVKQLASSSTSPNQKIAPMRDSATSPVSGPITVETACGPDDIGVVDTACGTRQSSTEVAEKAVSPEEEYTAEAACSTVAEETSSVACSPAVQKVDASCSPSESIDLPMQDATCSPVATDAGKDREKTDAACSPIAELSDDVQEMKDATCSPVIEGVQAEKADAASSPADITVDAQSSPVDIAVELKDSTSSPVIALFRQDELISPMIVEVSDKETWTGSLDEQTAEASCTPMLSATESAAVEKQETATSPVNLQTMRDEECSPIAVDSARETRDASCSPPDFDHITLADERQLTSVAVSPIRTTDGTLDKATSPPETFPAVSAGVSPFAQTVGVEQASSPHKVYTKDTSSSPFPESAGPFAEGMPTAATTKPVTFDVCLGTTPEDEKGVRAEFVDVACSPVAFEYSHLSRSSSGSTEVDIAVRSSSLEEATKTPMTDITAIRTLVETGTSPIGEMRTTTASDSAGVQVKPSITHSGTSPLIPLGQTKGTSTEDIEAQHALSDSCTSPLERIALSKSAATRDASSSPIENADATAAGAKTLKDVVLLKKPGPLRKTRSWDTMGYGNLDEIRSKELLFPEIRLPSGLSSECQPRQSSRRRLRTASVWTSETWTKVANSRSCRPSSRRQALLRTRLPQPLRDNRFQRETARVRPASPKAGTRRVSLSSRWA
ncbi:ankyrin repeat domain-containing protein 12-like isoform X1 [Dermacentor silvarum]|uniref:ankyrin repeat domain-containing protein 12-like isoform X1 n=1 Tax=Dermacentor silvarum TaxID=543639 RepID=UPI0021009471|nr:ankyrin repeat domain-containing protein 12-like isoform X1 [Dermacentor silvarum]